MFGVPINDDGGEQVKPGHAIVLPFRSSVSDFALAADTQGVFQSVTGLTFVLADLGTTPHVCVEELFDDEEGALDAADFAERQGQLMLARIGGELLEQLAGWHDACHHGGG